MKAQIISSLTVTNTTTGVNASLAPAGYNGTLVEESLIFERVSIPTSATLIPAGAIASSGWLSAKNEDPTNYVELSMNNDGSTPFARMYPNDPPALIPVPTTTVYAKAHTGACIISYLWVAKTGTPP